MDAVKSNFTSFLSSLPKYGLSKKNGKNLYFRNFLPNEGYQVALITTISQMS